MATRVVLNGYQGMRINSKPPSILSDDDDGVQSGSATGFSDEQEDLSASHIQTTHVKKSNMAFDPVTQILDKIDAELSSLTRSQASSSTATDSTIVRCPASLMSTESGSRLDNGDSLTMSQLGSTIQKPSFSSISSGSRPPGSIDRDTGIGTATSSFNTDRQRSRSVEDRRVLDLEPGDAFKEKQTRALSPDFSYLNGHHIGQSDDDKSKQERQSAAPYEAKNVDERFKEIMQKRKGLLSKAGTDDDNQTIRTEDFVEKFQDTMVYSSADEAEKIKNLEDDLHSDGGSDTDTLQQKLAMLTHTPYTTKDGRTSPCPVPRPLDRPRRRIAQSFEIKPKKVGGPGTPPVYPKPTPTASLPRPSTRSSLKLAPGNTSDADSVRTEDFENRFKDMLIMGKERETGESDLDGGMTSDPIHTKVKELLKATAKYDNRPAPFTTSILKSRYKTLSDKPKPELKPKPHVRISPKLPQYQDQDKGDDSDDTLCSDKDNRVASPRSPRSWSGWFWRQNPNGPGLVQDYGGGRYTSQVSNSSSLDDSLSKSSQSLSASSVSSSEKEKHTHHRPDENSINKQRFLKETNNFGFDFSRQVSQISSADSSYSDYSQNNSRSESTSESLVDDELSYLHALYLRGADRSSAFPGYQSSQLSGALRRRSISDGFYNGPYIHKKLVSENMKKEKKKEKKRRDLIVQDEEEEEFPFSKYTFNKKTNSSTKSEDSSSIRSSVSQRSTSRDSICSTGVMNQFLHLRKGNKRLLQNSLSSNSLFSSSSLSLNDTFGSADEFNSHYDNSSFDMKHRHPSHFRSQMSNGPGLFPQASFQQDRSNYNNMGSHMSASPTYASSQMEQMLSNLGISLPSSLPERFLKSLVDKLYVSQHHEDMIRNMTPPFNPANYPRDNYGYPEDLDLPPSVSAQQSGASTPMWRQSFENQPNPPDTIAWMKRQQLHRANTINNSASFSQASSCNKDSLEEHGTDNLYSQVGPLPLQKENSFDKLKRILQTTDRIQHHREKDLRRSMYGLNRQKSLPLFLETLSEEEEERRRSRTPSFDKSKGGVNVGSKLRSLHEDLERSSAKSSEDTSDASRRSSINQNTSVADMLFSVRKSLSTIDNDGDSSSANEVFNEEGQIKASPKPESLQSVPCILVTGRDMDNSNETCSEAEVNLYDTETERLLKHELHNHSDKRMSSTRPKSPTPEGNGEEGIVSKDSLEVAEILSPSDKKVPVISVLSKIDSVNEEDKTSPHFFKASTSFNHVDDSNKYLKIYDYDERHLPHTPSTASPISPITVIDMNKLDNQLEPCELDEVSRSNGTSSSDKVSMRFGDDKKRMSASEGRVSKTSNTSGSKSIDQPHCTGSLALERRSYYAEPISDSERNTSEEQVEVEVENKYDDRCVQASLEPLTPLMGVSEISKMLEHLFRKLPQRRENMFYLAQDKEVQCDLIKDTAQPCCSCYKQGSEVSTGKQSVENSSISEKRNTMVDNKHEKSIEPSKYTNTTDGAFNYKVSVSNNDHGAQHANKYCTYKTFSSYEKKKPFLLNYDNVINNTRDSPETSPKIFRSEAFFILRQQSSEESDIVKKPHQSSKQTFDEVDAKNNCSVKIKKSKHTNTNKGMKRKHSVCKIITEPEDDIHNDSDVISHIYVQDELGAGFEEMVTSYVNYCKQTVTEGTTELKSPNSLTVERFEYEPWDTLDLRKVLDVFEKNITVENDQEILSERFIEKENNQTSSQRKIESVDNIHKTERNSFQEQTFLVNNKTDKTYYSEDSIGIQSIKESTTRDKRVSGKEHEQTVTKMLESVPFKTRPQKKLLTKCAVDTNSYHAKKVDEFFYETENDCDIPQNSDNQCIQTTDNDSTPRFTSKATLTFSGTSESSREGHKVLSSNQQVLGIPTKPKCLSNDVSEADGVETNSNLVTSSIHFNFGNNSSESSICNTAKNETIDRRGDLKETKYSIDVRNSDTWFKNVFKSEKSINDQATSQVSDKTILRSGLGSRISSTSHSLPQERHLPSPSSNTLNDRKHFQVAVDPTNNRDYIYQSALNDPNKSVHERTNNASKIFKSVQDKSDLSYVRNEETIAEKLSSHSLDFETHDSRKNILQRCNNAAFSKSFDIFGSFSEFNSIEDGPNKGLIPSLRKELTDHALEKLNENFLQFESIEEHVDEIFNTSNGSRSMQYQIGVKENEHGEFCDVFGRIKMVKSENEDITNNHQHFLHDNSNCQHEENVDGNLQNYINVTDIEHNEKISGGIMYNKDGTFQTEGNVDSTVHNNNTVDGSMYNDESVDIKESNEDQVNSNLHDINIPVPDINQITGKSAFDIFAQIDEDADDHRDLNHTDKTLQELERLYKQSIDEDYASDDKTVMTDVSQRLSFSSILEELDHEISQMEAYQNRFQYYESHICKNCGHTVSITTTEIPQGQVEHDYCRECSPLDLTAEMLERRRLEKMMKTSIDYNKSTE